MAKKSKQQKSGLTALFKYAEIKKSLLTTGLIFSVLSAALSLVFPLFIANLIDSFRKHFSLPLVLAVIVTLLFSTLFSVLNSYTMGKASQVFIASIRKKASARLMNIPIKFFTDKQSGEISNHIANDTQSIDLLIRQNVSSFISGVILVIGSIVILFLINWSLTLIVLLALIAVFLILSPISNIQNKTSASLQSELGHFSSHLNQVASEIRMIKSFNGQESQKEKLDDSVNRLYRFNMKVLKINSLLDPIEYTILFSSIFFVLIIGGLMVSSSGMTIGALVSFFIYFLQIMTPISSIAQTINQFQSANGASKWLVDLLKTGEETDNQQVVPTGTFASPLVFDQVSFAYNPTADVLSNLNFKIPAGSVTAFVGPSGGGKSTIISLIEKFYLPSKGELSMAGKNIQNFGLHYWRDHVAYVPQQGSVLVGTLRENLTIGLKKEVSDEQINQALKDASAFDFVEKLPKKLDTDLSERGANLSGGQLQRIMIARAFLKQADIYIFDEATASLDSQSEFFIQQAIDKIKAKATIIMIAHRLATVKNADQILFLDHGQITGEGTHDELYQTHPLYRKYVQEQLLKQG
ncbi:MAG: ABC transporter ATP-binding protein [Oenococcus sp.]|uniref:ABC transporter ATP-binding protein n=1 Tax=Oenococcus sp. TaxID=1979414 RepID=UPI0039EC95E3